jgi:hypothetical protein
MSDQNQKQQDEFLAKRLAAAFASAKPSDSLAEKVRQSLEQPVAAAGTPARRTARFLAAALLLVAVGTALLFFGQTSDAMAAQKNLVKIHQSNLAPQGSPFRESDPQRVAARIQKQLGCCPLAPVLDSDAAMQSSCTCVNCTCDPAVCSYLVDTDSGPISVIVVPDPPEAMGMTPEASGLWKSVVGSNNLVARRVNDLTYCVVGAVSDDALTKLLTTISL